MKELSIEEKAKVYDEAFERAKQWCNAPNVDKIPTFANRIIKEIFPELKESEDERIRKSLIILLQHFCKGYRVPGLNFPVSYKDMLAWLEKQGEQKSIDNTEPKFKVGDWVVYNNDICQIVKREEGCNKLVTVFGIEKELVNERNLSTARLWSIEDAKDGDVLVTEPINGYPSPFIAIYKERGLDFFNSYCFVGFDGKFYEADTGHSTEEIHPATKEQRDILIKAMKEAGYTFDFKKKELKLLITNGGDFDEKNCEQKHSIDINKMVDDYANNRERGNEEFGKPVPCMIRAYRQGLNDAIGKVVLKPAWSEEDIRNIQDIDSVLFYDKSLSEDTCMRLRNWLESLRPQNKWKPSDEQLDALHDAAVYVDKSMFPYPKGILIKLYKQLKKLREE